MTTKRKVAGQHRRSCQRCGWAGVYRTAGIANYAKRQHSCDKQLAVAARLERGRVRRAAIDRTPKLCLHKFANHQHGTYACYVVDGCKCRPCADANSEYESRRIRLQAYGRWNNLVDAQPVRDHVRGLMAAGMGYKRIAEVAGVSKSTVMQLLFGKHRATGARTPTKRIRREAADLILACELDLAAGASVDATGTRRRVQALVAIGYSMARVAAEVGMLPSNFASMLERGRVLRSTAETVSAVYDRWSMTPAVGNDQRSRISVSRAKRYAATRAWAPPLAWDDDTIDSPTATPAYGTEQPAAGDVVHVDESAVIRRMAGDKKVRLNNVEKRIVVDRLTAQHVPLNEIERRTGINTHRLKATQPQQGEPAA